MNENALIDGIEDAEFVEIDGDSEDVSDLQKDLDSQMQNIFSEFGGDPNDTTFRIDVKRTIPNKGVNEDCFSCTPDELPIKDRIRTEFGPGQYHIYIYKNNRIFRRRTLRIAAPLKKPYAPPVQNSGSDIKDILLAMQENQRQQWEQMQSLMLNNNQPTQMDSMRNTLEMMTLMKGIMGESPKQQDPMSTVKLAKELAEMMGDGGDKSTLDRLLDHALPMLVEGAKTAQENQGQNVTQPVILGPGNISMRPQEVPLSYKENPASRMNPQNNQPERDPNQMIQMVIKSKLKELINLASKNKDPDLYAEVYLDNVPEMYLEKYLGFINQENYLSELEKLNSDVTLHKDWFDRFKASTMAIVLEGTEGDEDTPKEEETLTNDGDVVQTSDNVSESIKTDTGEIADQDDGNPTEST